ncbi:MAG: Flp pilus assembly complex ATPase component TadA, partial [Deltaproteobacteria bacterium]|nr:Flp pilus assembly complex ATPase component TadA [Deltaproteobacteria bacterium]
MNAPAKKPLAAPAKAASGGLGQQLKRPDGTPPSLDNIVEKMVADNAKTAIPTQAKSEDSADAQAPVVLLVHTLLREALRRQASDIHVEPFEDTLRVRFRIDGALQEIQQLPVKLTGAILSRLKIMAELDICERRIPQDGCIRLRSQTVEEADFRLSTLPSVFGEKAVLRVLERNNLNKNLEEIGLPPSDLKLIRDAISKPDGLVLV